MIFISKISRLDVSNSILPSFDLNLTRIGELIKSLVFCESLNSWKHFVKYSPRLIKCKYSLLWTFCYTKLQGTTNYAIVNTVNILDLLYNVNNLDVSRWVRVYLRAVRARPKSSAYTVEVYFSCSNSIEEIA